MPSLTNLRTEDYMAISRAMDTNRNNRIDTNEANVSGSAQRQIGNANGVVGTREFATSLESGDIFLNALSPATADKVAEYFSKHNENFDRPVAEWISDAWVSKADFTFSDDNKAQIDSNGDNKVSAKELAAALTSGSLSIGRARQTSNDPFTNPQPNRPAQGHDPFANPQPNRPAQGHDPFANQPSRPAHGNDPFSQPSGMPDSGAYMQLEMIRGMSSDYSKTQMLTEIAQKSNLSPREQAMVADTAMKHIDSDYSKTQILQLLAQNSNLHEDGAIQVAKSARGISSDYSKSQLVDLLVNSQRLAPRAQQSVIITIGTIDSDHSKTQSFINLINKQDLHPQNKQLLLDTVNKEISSDYSKQQIMNAMF